MLAYSPDAVLEQLRESAGGSDETPSNVNRDQLLASLELQRATVWQLKAGVQDQSTAVWLLVAYLQQNYATISGLPGSMRYNQLELSIIKHGLLAPFVPDIDVPTKAMTVGMPTDLNATADSLPEVALLASSAFVCLWHYLNFRHAEGGVPSDDAALLLCTQCIRSLSQPDVCAAFDQQLAELNTAMASQPLIPPTNTHPEQAAHPVESDPGAAEHGPAAAGKPLGEAGEVHARPVLALTAAQCRWLMHWMRAELCGWISKVQMLLGDARAEHSLLAMQQDWLSAIKQVPDNLVAYVGYVRSCLQFQQHRPAYIFAHKGLQVEAGGHRDDLSRAHLLCLRAVATALGGSGQSHFTPRAIATALEEAQATLARLRSWLPANYHDLLTVREAGMIWWSLLPAAAAIVEAGGDPSSVVPRDGAADVTAITGVDEGAAEEEGHLADPEVQATAHATAAAEAIAGASDCEVPVLSHMSYTTAPPVELPVGALTQLAQAQADAQAAAARTASDQSKGAGAKAGGAVPKGGPRQRKA